MGAVYRNGAEAGHRFQFERWGGVAPYSSPQNVTVEGSCSQRAQSCHYFGEVHTVLGTGLSEFYQRDYVDPSAGAWGGNDLGRLHGWDTAVIGLGSQIYVHNPVTTGADGHVELFIGGSSVASSPAGVLTNARMKIDYHVLVAGSGGRFEMRVDDVPVIDFTGDTLVSSAAFTHFLFWGYGDFGSPALCHDDIGINSVSGSINNGWLGEGSIRGFFPVEMGTGANTLTGTGDATDRHLNIDDRPTADDDCVSSTTRDPQQTTFNSGSTDGLYDLYAFDFSSVAAVQTVTLWARVAAFDGSYVVTSGGQFRFVYKMNGIEYRSAAITCPAGAAGTGTMVPLVLQLNPEGNPWAYTDLATFEAGIEVEGSTEVRLYQFLVEIEGMGSEACTEPSLCILETDDDILFITGGAVELLPASMAHHRIYRIKNIGTGTVTVIPAAGETIDGLSTLLLMPYDSLTLVSDGTNWYRL